LLRVKKMRANGETIDTLIKDWVIQNTKMERQIAQLQKRISVLKWEMPRAGPEQPVSHAEGSPFLLT